MLRAIAIAALLSLSAGAAAADPEHHDVEVFGQNIHYAETGSGRPLILLHGLWGGINEWQPVIEPLAQDHRVIVMDFLGFHSSDLTHSCCGGHR